MPLPLSQDVLIHEIRGAIAALSKWEKLLSEGIPMADDEKLDVVLFQLRGDLMVCSGKLSSLADVVGGQA